MKIVLEAGRAGWAKALLRTFLRLWLWSWAHGHYHENCLGGGASFWAKALLQTGEWRLVARYPEKLSQSGGRVRKRATGEIAAGRD
jgi:hypothetical protein